MSSIGSSALVSVVTGLVEVVGSLERSCPVCGAESAGVAAGVGTSVAGFSSVFFREAFVFLGEEISLSFLPELTAVSVRGCARTVVASLSVPLLLLLYVPKYQFTVPPMYCPFVYFSVRSSPFVIKLSGSNNPAL